MSINIQQVPNAPPGYDLTGKKVMVHDQTAPLATSTVLVNATSFGRSGGGLVSRMWKEADADMTAGASTITKTDLVGASELHEITVNKIIEYVDQDFTFDDVTGTIDRSPNQWFASDVMVAKFKLAI